MPPNKKEPSIEEALKIIEMDSLLENITYIAVYGALMSKVILDLLDKKGVLTKADIEYLLKDSDYLESFRKQLLKKKFPWIVGINEPDISSIAPCSSFRLQGSK